VTPEEIKALRKDLGCSARELAAAVGVDQATVLAWESGERFPTKQWVTRMTALHAQGRRDMTSASGVDAMKALADPNVWKLLRKLAVHDAFRREVAKLAERYPDPADR